ncbi:MAG TPA: YdeI/OmpD-associated family protein [Nitrospiria bacterium]|nr:YdeI/OmpD-associated family protein [Nitrospiria bacterium]
MAVPKRKVESRTGVQVFKTRLESMGEGEAWTVFRMPFSVEEVFGTGARVPVKGTINGFPFRSSLFPMGEGRHFMMVNKEMWEGAKIREGRPVEVVLQKDTDVRTLQVPRDLKTALSQNKNARNLFEKLSFTHKREFIRWVESAKRPETRARRIRNAVTRIAQGRTYGSDE